MLAKLACSIGCVALMLAGAVGCGDDGADPGGDPDSGGRRDSSAGLDGGGGRDTGPAGPVTCSEYCVQAIAACSGENTLYPTMDACMSYCQTNAGWPVGTRGDPAENSLSCRHYHATNAIKSLDPDLHCPHAGPSGGNACGTWCENYCQLAGRNCTGANQIYASDAECMTACARIDDDAPAGSTTGDSIQCRIYHVGVAGTDAASATMHCPHGSPTATDPCI